MVQLSPDLGHFTRVLEGVRRYMDACWHPYPDENAAEDFVEDMDDLAPGIFDENTLAGKMWLYFIVGITGLNEDGF